MRVRDLWCLVTENVQRNFIACNDIILFLNTKKLREDEEITYNDFLKYLNLDAQIQMQGVDEELFRAYFSIQQNSEASLAKNRFIEKVNKFKKVLKSKKPINFLQEKQSSVDANFSFAEQKFSENAVSPINKTKSDFDNQVNNFKKALKNRCKSRNLKDVKLIWSDPIFQAYFSGLKVTLQDGQFQINSAECFNHFEFAIRSQNITLIKDMWKLNSLGLNEFIASLEDDDQEIFLQTILANFRYPSSVKPYIEMVRDAVIKKYLENIEENTTPFGEAKKKFLRSILIFRSNPNPTLPLEKPGKRKRMEALPGEMKLEFTPDFFDQYEDLLGIDDLQFPQAPLPSLSVWGIFGGNSPKEENTLDLCFDDKGLDSFSLQKSFFR